MTETIRIGYADLDPQEEPITPAAVEPQDWRDLCFDADRSLRNATRCDEYPARRANLLVAKRQVDLVALAGVGAPKAWQKVRR